MGISDMFDDKLGPRVKYLRIEAGLSRKDFYGMIVDNMNPSHVAKWENPKYKLDIPYKYRHKVAKLLGISLETLEKIADGSEIEDVKSKVRARNRDLHEALDKIDDVLKTMPMTRDQHQETMDAVDLLREFISGGDDKK